MKEYENKLKSTIFKKMYVMTEKDFLYPVEIQDCEKVVKSFNDVLENYSDYITDSEKVIDLFRKIETLQYINIGRFSENKWIYNEHRFIINGLSFEYRTGVGINCTESKSGSFNYYKLILNAVYCFLIDANYAMNYTEDDFLEELGYTESVEMFRKGQKAYNACKETFDKCVKIWGKDTVNNIYDIIQL